MKALRDYKAVITAGGTGTRLLPFSKEIPKEMFPIFAPDENGSMRLKPLVQAIFEQLRAVGLRSSYFVVGGEKRTIEDHFSPDLRFLRYLESKGKLPSSLSEFYEKIRSSNIVFLNQPEPLGFGDAVLMGRPLIDEDFMLLGPQARHVPRHRIARHGKAPKHLRQRQPLNLTQNLHCKT